MRRIVVTSVVALALWAVAAPALAHDSRGDAFPPGPSSVFPTPRDPWRSWGVSRPEGTRHVERRGVVVAPAPVWVPGQWVWTDAGWAWWPAHWAQ